MYNLPQFLKSNWTLIVYQDKKTIFKSKARGLKPLIIFIEKFGRQFKDLIVFDKIVGRAAALLLVYIKVSKVYTPLISQAGVLVLKKYRISFETKRQVKYIIGYGSKELCQWEKLAKNKTPAQFWQLVKTL